ncbi:MAG: valine--tRNA ligase [Alphaproteobacteria bacterium]|nr:valine--tRNA ligase [Alphaproteobacteria bacterium]
MLEKSYRPQEIEEKQYRLWEESGAFAAGKRHNATPYTIVIPPPNVTGSLHMGHALNNTLQDVLIRYERMRGRDALWQPGMDHAGIATQMVVERQLDAEGASRHDLGREAFIDRVWAWKAESGGTIANQLRRLGASCDWERERFTMDEGLSRAVLEVFVTLYKQGLIYKDKRLVNWDPKLHTAISDLEVEQREIQGHLWHIRYPIEGEEGRAIVVATTRPETMLGDTAVAVHPDDDRYRDLIGRYAVLPLVGRLLRIVADGHADPEQGSGAVKITPAHDFNDFEVGRRHDLELVNVLDEDAVINHAAPEAYRGLDRYDARDKVVADLEARGLVEKVEEHTHVVPYGDRSGVVIEPWLTDQWYVDAATLAKPAIEAVRSGRTVFVPRHWERTYFEWMENIQPWCVSRQLWWGHQIPAWYGPDGEIFVERTEEEARSAAEAHYGKSVELTRDEDVLDTWFSSALWPFSTLGWPDETPELERHYPTDVLVTGFDIIFFWVARMMMMGLHFMDEVPFHTVYIHALVRDEKGQKMSKSKGNIMDPLAVADGPGADALRFTLAAMAAQGRDVKLSRSRIEGYRNFATKLWNAARFCEMNECRDVNGFDPTTCRLTVNKWIVGEVGRLSRRVAEEIEAYRFNEAAGAAYRGTWGTFCDWYLELIKSELQNGTAEAKAETRVVAGWALDRILQLLHPFMPFVTEELWQQTGKREAMLIESAWPELSEDLVDLSADAEMDWVIRLISEVRAVRAEMNVPAKAQIGLWLNGAGEENLRRLKDHAEAIIRLARLEGILEGGREVPTGAVQIVLDDATIVLPLSEIIDIARERERLSRELDKARGEIAKLDMKLSNRGFLAKAPEHVVEEQHERKRDAESAELRLAAALARL